MNMKITYDGITIEDAKMNEIVEFIKSYKNRMKRGSLTEAGVFNLPEDMSNGTEKKKNVSRAGRPQQLMWAKDEVLFIIKNVGKMKAKEFINAQALSGRTPAAIAAKVNAIKNKDVERMGVIAYELMKGLGLLEQYDRAKYGRIQPA